MDLREHTGDYEEGSSGLLFKGLITSFRGAAWGPLAFVRDIPSVLVILEMLLCRLDTFQVIRKDHTREKDADPIHYRHATS